MIAEFIHSWKDRSSKCIVLPSQRKMREKRIWIVVTLILLSFPFFVAPDEGIVYEFTENNFQQPLLDFDATFIMFYTTWCSHCKEFAPIWKNLADIVNVRDSNIAIAQVDCEAETSICQTLDITGYPTLLYYDKETKSFTQYKGTRDLLSLTMFLRDNSNTNKVIHKADTDKSSEVKIYSGMVYLSDLNIEKFVSKGQHFIMFFASWCRASQKLAPIWAELAIYYANNEYIQIGQVDCMENDITCKTFDVKQYPFLMWIVNGRIMGISDANNLEDLKTYVQKMLLAENHDPDKFMKKKKALPVARITEETFETFLEKDLVFVNYFAPWCAHCMQLSPLWLQLGEKFQNESRVLIADVDCARSKPICETERINGLPTLILYRQKKIVNVENGGRPLETLIGMVKEQLEGKQEEIAETKPKDEL